jgi:ABC-type uncharacterized transport system auxiliary subunit
MSKKLLGLIVVMCILALSGCCDSYEEPTLPDGYTYEQKGEYVDSGFKRNSCRVVIRNKNKHPVVDLVQIGLFPEDSCTIANYKAFMLLPKQKKAGE